MSPNQLVSIGYEGRSVEELIDDLRRESVTVLVDVRLTPLSRKPGMSKRRLADALACAGIRYVHLSALGNPKTNRQPFRDGDPRSRSTYRAILEQGDGVTAMRAVQELLAHETVALLCFEREHDACHRHVVADELRRVEPSLDLVAC